MLYQRSREIEARLADLVRLIESGRYSTPKLATVLGISKPTVARCLSALRDRGFRIQAVKGPEGWAYEIEVDPPLDSPKGGQTV